MFHGWSMAVGSLGVIRGRNGRRLVGGFFSTNPVSGVVFEMVCAATPRRRAAGIWPGLVLLMLIGVMMVMMAMMVMMVVMVMMVMMVMIVS